MVLTEQIFTYIVFKLTWMDVARHNFLLFRTAWLRPANLLFNLIQKFSLVWILHIPTLLILKQLNILSDPFPWRLKRN